jgi:histidinol-phosphate phosphatase family protein
VKSADEWVPVPGALEAIARLNHAGWHTVIASNQSGLARGLFDMAALNAIHARMNRELAEVGGRIDAIFFCPHGPDDGCHCRPPEPGLILWAAGRVCTAPADCAVVGTAADAEAAARVGAHGILVPDERTRPEETARADHVAPDVLTAVRALLTGPPQGRVLVDERPIESAFEPGFEPEKG